MRKFLHSLPFLLLLVMLLLAIFSWIGSVYGMQVQNLLSADGIRWSVSQVLPNFQQSPWAEILLGMMAVSVLVESDFLSTILPTFRTKQPHHRRSLKQRRALLLAMLMILLGLVALAALTFLPQAILLSAFGTFDGSSLQAGIYPIILFLLTLAAITYGFAAGRFFTLAHIVNATAYLPSRLATYWFTLFISSQFVAQLSYVFSIPDSIIVPIAYTLYFFPLLLHFLLLSYINRPI